MRQNIDADLVKILSCLSTSLGPDGFLQTLQYAGCPRFCIIYASGIKHLPNK